MHALIVLNYLSPPLRLPLGIPIKIARSPQPPYDTKRSLRSRDWAQLPTLLWSNTINLHVYETKVNWTEKLKCSVEQRPDKKLILLFLFRQKSDNPLAIKSFFNYFIQFALQKFSPNWKKSFAFFDLFEVFKTPKRQNLVWQRAKLVMLRHPWITQASWFYLNPQLFHFSGRKRSSASFGNRNWPWNQEVVGGWIQVFLVMYSMRAGRVLSRHSRDKPIKEPSKYFCYYKDLFLILLPIRLVRQQRQRLHRRRKCS